MGDGPVFTSFPFLLRLVEIITSIVAFSVIIDLKGWSKANYIIYVGVTGFVMAFLYCILYLARVKSIRGKFSVALDGLWAIFWLCAAAVATSIITVDKINNSKTRSSCAFSWISFVLWCLSLVIDLREAQGYEY